MSLSARGMFLSARNLYDKGALNAYTYLLVLADNSPNFELLAKVFRAFSMSDNWNLELFLRYCLDFDAKSNEFFCSAGFAFSTGQKTYCKNEGGQPYF